MIKKCFFCSSKAQKESILTTGGRQIIIDENPITPKHILISPLQHIISLFDLSVEERNKLQSIINIAPDIIEKVNRKKSYSQLLSSNPSNKFIQKALKSAHLNQKPNAYNIGINDGKAAGRTINHLHIHIIPRYNNDTANPIGGIRNLMPGMGDYTQQ